MHALLLSLALGQAAPDTAAPSAAPTEPAPASIHAPEAPTPPPPAPPGRGGEGRSLRAVDFTRLPDGSFQATLEGQPVAGADFYRAVLRPDLAARTEEARAGRTALLVGAVLAPLAGLGVGWVAGTSQQWPLPPCTGAPPGPVSCLAHDQVAAQNQSAMQTSLLVGGAVGLATGAALALAGASIHPPEPTADEAEALVRAYRARAAAGVPSPPTPAPVKPGGATLRLAAAPGVAWLALRVAF
jgi:hypothetical protein